jgi:hypothetical protein
MPLLIKIKYKKSRNHFYRVCRPLSDTDTNPFKTRLQGEVRRNAHNQLTDGVIRQSTPKKPAIQTFKGLVIFSKMEAVKGQAKA